MVLVDRLPLPGTAIRLHHLLDAFMDPQRLRVVIGPPFYPVHRMYL